MLRYNFRIAIRRLFSNKLNSLFNILGLAVGMTSVILMLLYINYESTYDFFNEDHEQLYRVERSYFSQVQNELYDDAPYVLAKELIRDFPEVENGACVRATSRYLGFGDAMYQENFGAFADNQFLQLFSFNFKEGNRLDALSNPMSIVLSESLAKKIAPQGSLLGETIKLDKKYNFTVKGIFEDLPENSHLEMDYMISFNSHNELMGTDENRGWDVNNATVYLKLIKNTDREQLGEKVSGYLNQKMPSEDGSKQILSLRPITDIYINAASVRGTGNKRNDKVVIYLFLCVAIFTSLISVLNYVNSSTADVINRELEIGIKKVLCISKTQLRFQFICESLVLVLLAFVIAMLLLFLALPLFNTIIGKNITIDLIRDGQFFLKIFFSVLLVGVLAGLYPVFFLSSLKISSFLQGNASVKRRTLLRKALVVFQLAVVMPLIFMSIVIIKQIDFIQEKDVGFDRYNLLVSKVKTDDETAIERLKSSKTRLLQNPNITDFTITSSVPFIGASELKVNWEGSNEEVALRKHEVDFDFFNTFKIQLVEGRSFSKDYGTDRENACVINERAMKIFGWKSAVGKKLDNGRLTVIGVAKDFNDFSLFMRIPPMIMVMHPETYKTHYATMRVNNSERISVQKEVNSHFNEVFPNDPLNFKYLDADFDHVYLNALKEVTRIFIFFSIVAIVLAILGLYSLVSFSLKAQRKMIAVRKVLGASIQNLFMFLLKEYLILFAIAASIGLLLGYFASIKVMDALAYHEETNIMYLVVSALLALLVVLFSVSSKIYVASKESPIIAISSE